MDNLINFLTYVKDNKVDFSYEKSKGFHTSSALVVLENHLKEYTLRSGYSVSSNHELSLVEIYQSKLEYAMDVLIAVDETLESNIFENKQYNEDCSFYDEIEDFIDKQNVTKINKKNIVKHLENLENNIRNFVVNKYLNSINTDVQKNDVIEFIENKKQNKSTIIDIVGPHPIKSIEFSIDNAIFRVKINNEWQDQPTNQTEAILLGRKCMDAIISSELKNNQSF